MIAWNWVECKQLQKTNQTLRVAINKQILTKESLKDYDAEVEYYTGLPSFTISSLSENKSRATLSHFQQFLMLFMKLQLNLGDQDLAYKFSVNQSVNCVWTFQEMDKCDACSAQSSSEVAKESNEDTC